MTSFAEASLQQWREKVPALLETCRVVGLEQLGEAVPYYRAMGARRLGSLAADARVEVLAEPGKVDATKPGAILFADLRIVMERQTGDSVDHKLLCRLWPEEDGLQVVTKGFEDDAPKHWRLSNSGGIDRFVDRYGASLQWFVGEEFPDGVPY